MSSTPRRRAHFIVLTPPPRPYMARGQNSPSLLCTACPPPPRRRALSTPTQGSAPGLPRHSSRPTAPVLNPSIFLGGATPPPRRRRHSLTPQRGVEGHFEARQTSQKSLKILSKMAQLAPQPPSPSATAEGSAAAEPGYGPQVPPPRRLKLRDGAGAPRRGATTCNCTHEPP